MDPSYTNRVGVQAPPNSQNTATQGTGPVRQIPVRQVPPSGGMMSQQPIIASGPDEMALSGTEGAGGAGKSRKGVIVLIILIVLLALVGGGLWLWQNGMLGDGGGSQSQTTNGLEEKYNSYVNYVLWGVESNGKPDLVAMNEATPYFEKVRNDETALGEYALNTEQKYNELKQAYAVAEIEEKTDIAVLESYFENYPVIPVLTQSELLVAYLAGGEEEAQELLNDTYSAVDAEKYFSNYLKAEKELGEQILKMIIKADTAGCVKEGKITNNCSEMNDSDSEAMGKAVMNASGAMVEMSSAAYGVLGDLYVGLYNAEEVGSENE